MPTVPTPTLPAFLEELAALGLRTCGPADPGAQAFAVLKAASKERWLLVPLRGRRSVAAALRMLTPMSPRSRAAKTAVLLLNALGLRPVWTREQVHLGGFGEAACARDWPSATFFSGTPGPDRKITVQLQDRDGRSDAYLKLSCSPRSARLIAGEFRALRRAHALGLASAVLPSVLWYRRMDGRHALLCSDETARGHRTVRHLDRRHFAFLDEMAQRTRTTVGASYLETLRARVQEGAATGPDDLAERALDVLASLLAPGEVAAGLAHGDFTPWNCALAGDRLYVFDWELSATQPLGYDHLHFLASTRGKDLLGDHPRLLEELQRRWHPGSPAGVRFLLIAYLLGRISGEDAPAGRDLLRRVLSDPGGR